MGTPYNSSNIFVRSNMFDVSPEPAPDTEQLHTVTVNLPERFKLNKLFQDRTFILRLSGGGAGRITDNELGEALVGTGLCTTEEVIAPHGYWFRYENHFVRYFRHAHPTILPNSDLDTAKFATNTERLGKPGTSNEVQVEIIDASNQTET